ncbi:MAG: helix-turn-helix domain-containing protein [Planctomycetota bacterium]
MIAPRHRFLEHLDALEASQPDPDLAERAAAIVARGYALIRAGLCSLGLELAGPIRITPEGDLESEDGLVISDEPELSPAQPGVVVAALREALHDERRGLRVAQVAQAVGRSASTVYAWIAGRVTPSAASAAALVEFLAQLG